MFLLKFIHLAVGSINQNLTREQRKMFLCEYSDIDKIPTEIREHIAAVHLDDDSHLKKLFGQCNITDINVMVDIIIRNLYVVVNYVPMDEWENKVF